MLWAQAFNSMTGVGSVSGEVLHGEPEMGLFFLCHHGPFLCFEDYKSGTLTAYLHGVLSGSSPPYAPASLAHTLAIRFPGPEAPL